MLLPTQQTTPQSARGAQSAAMTGSSEEEAVGAASDIPVQRKNGFTQMLNPQTTPTTEAKTGLSGFHQRSSGKEGYTTASRSSTRLVGVSQERAQTLPQPLCLSERSLLSRASFPFDLVTPRVRVVSRPHTGAVTSIHFSNPRSGHPLLTSGGYDGYVGLLDPAILQIKFSMRVAPNDSAVVLVELSEDQERIAAACLDDVVYVANIKRQETVASFAGHQGRIVRIGFLSILAQTSASEQSPEATTEEAAESVCHIESNENESFLTARRNITPSIMNLVTPIRHVYSVSVDRSIRVWDIERDTCVSTVRTPHGITAASAAQQGRILVLGHQNGCISLWQLAPKDVPRKLDWTFRQMFMFKPLAPPTHNVHTHAIHEGPVFAVCFSPKGDTIYSVGKEGRLTQLSVARATTDGKSFRMPTGFRPCNAVGAAPETSPCGKYLALVSDTGLTCWDAVSGRCVASWGAATPATCLVWTASNALITGHSDGTLLLWCFS